MQFIIMIDKVCYIKGNIEAFTLRFATLDYPCLVSNKDQGKKQLNLIKANV